MSSVGLGTLPPMTSELGFPPSLGQQGFYQPSAFTGSGRSTGNNRNAYDTKGSTGPGPIRATNFNSSAPETNMPGLMSNYWVSEAKLVRSFTEQYMKPSQIYHLMITKKETRPVIANRPRGQKNNARRYTMYNIPMFNYMMAVTAKFSKRILSADKYLSPEDIWSMWSVEGVCTSEEGQSDPHADYEEGKERIINTVLRGQVSTFNGWGNNIGHGTHLWLILRKPAKAFPREYYIRGNSNEKDTVGNGDDLTDRPYQLTFYANCEYTYPPDSELCFIDDLGTKRMGLPIYIGRALYPAYCQNPDALGECTRNFARLTTQPQITIHLNS